MDVTALFQVMERMEKSSLTKLSWEYEGGSITLEKGTAPVMAVASAPVVAATPVAPVVETPKLVVTAPLVGTFYAASEPGATPFVSVGQTVKKGEPICLLEAMKTMNEIPAPCDLVVEEILVSDGDLVPFGEGIIAYGHV